LNREPAIATVDTSTEPAAETSLPALLDHLGIERAHFAARGAVDLPEFIARCPERIASLTLLCPAVLDPPTLAPLGARVLVVTGDHGPHARRTGAGLAQLPEARSVVLADYAGVTWADIAAERGDAIFAAMQDFITGFPLPPAGLAEQDGDIAEISYRVRGAGPPLILLPLDLSPGQWEPMIPQLAAQYCTVTLGGALFGSVASLEERGRSGYLDMVRRLLDTLAIRPGESVLEVGCGSGVIMREIGRASCRERV